MGWPGLGSTEVLTEWVRLLLATVFLTGWGVVELLDGVGRPFLTEGIPTDLTGGAMSALSPSFRGERLGMEVGEGFLAGGFISSSVDCLRGEGMGDRFTTVVLVGEGTPMPALIGECEEVIAAVWGLTGGCMMDMSLTDKEDINGGIFLVLVESTSIGSSSTANVEFRFLGAVFIPGLFSSHCLSSLVTRVTVSFKLVGAITSAPVGLSRTVSNVSLRLETEPSTALGVGGIVTVCLSMGCPGCCSFNFC